MFAGTPRIALRRITDDDSGFTMVELMAALLILALTSSAFAYGMHTALAVTRQDRGRMQATNLAARELEIVRNEFGASKTAPTTIGAVSQVVNPHPLPGGTSGNPLVVDETEFTVTRTVEWLPAGTGTSPCDGGAAVTYPSLAVNVKVTWQDRDYTQNVESNTVLTPPKGTLASIVGFIAAKVTGADGQGVASLPVDVTGPGGSQTRVTAADGCAVFAMTSVGNYSVVLDEPGHVSFDGQPTTSKSAVVAAGTIQVVPFSYDAAATLVFNYVPSEQPAVFGLPDPLPATVLFNPSLPTMGRKRIPSGTTTVSGLWPFPDGYSVWAGTCEVNDPAATGGQRPDPVAPEPGETLEVDLVLHPFRATFLDEDGQPVDDEQVMASLVDPDSCAPTWYYLGETDENGVIASSLPYGVWEVEADGYVLTAHLTSDSTFPMELS